MNYLDELAARRRFGMQPGLDAIRRASAALGDPAAAFPAIHVAGTNGKGAVTALLDAALRAEGLRVGRYTSPHLVRLNERFFLDGRPADDATLERLSERVAAVVGAELTFFEALTAVAFLLYAEARPDYTVLECGLGGRLDATNVCRPALTVITRIGLDHCDWLGDTVEKIAAEKAGIVKPGVPVVLGANEPSVRAVVAARAAELGAPFHYAPERTDEGEIPSGFALGGGFNRENAVTALTALKVLGRDTAAARAGFARVVWPGRFQRVGRFLVDGAHNPPAARALAQALAEEGYGTARKLDLIAGFCGDKDVDTVLRELAPFVRRAFAVRTNNPRSLASGATAERMRAAGLGAASCADLAAALRAVPDDGTAVLICGSLFLAGEALVQLDAYPWGPVRFDAAELLKP